MAYFMRPPQVLDLVFFAILRLFNIYQALLANSKEFLEKD
jgi:hypothetical protein